MAGKKKSGAAPAGDAAVQAVLRRGATRELSPEEEKVMRMRLGAPPPRGEELGRSGRGLANVEIELLAYEIEAHLKSREIRGSPARRPPPAPLPSRTKEKIVRALRKKS